MYATATVEILAPGFEPERAKIDALVAALRALANRDGVEVEAVTRDDAGAPTMRVTVLPDDEPMDVADETTGCPTCNSPDHWYHPVGRQVDWNRDRAPSAPAKVCTSCGRLVRKDERGDVLDASGRCDQCAP